MAILIGLAVGFSDWQPMVTPPDQPHGGGGEGRTEPTTSTADATSRDGDVTTTGIDGDVDNEVDGACENPRCGDGICCFGTGETSCSCAAADGRGP